MERKRNAKGVFLPIHGMKDPRLYKKWCSMKSRCNYPSSKCYPRYGGKGIKICDEWENSFESFYKWAMETGYKDGLTIDRIDNSKGYSPDNCRWATHAEQCRNYSRNRFITYQGRTQCMSDWADEYGINRCTLAQRIKLGWSLERAFQKQDGRSTRWQKKP